MPHSQEVSIDTIILSIGLIVFINIGVPGKTGHDFPNEYNPVEKTITRYGKPDTHSQQGTFQKLLNKELTPHFFARWNNTDPFVYLGIGTILKYEDGSSKRFTSPYVEPLAWPGQLCNAVDFEQQHEEEIFLIYLQ